MGEQDSGHWMNEPDIGSGAKSAAEREIERDQAMLGEQRRAEKDASGASEAAGADVLSSGDHLARIATNRLEDGSYEAQVFVRLAREPEQAETYIPAGNFQTEQQALAAARERAERALREGEF